MQHRCIVSALVAISVAASTPAWSQAVCRSADATSAQFKYHIGTYSEAKSADTRVVRDSLKLPVVAASQIALVTTESVCKKANAAYQSALSGKGGSGFTGRVYVLQIGTVYAVLDPGFRFDSTVESWAIVVLDSRLKVLSFFA